MLVEQGKHFARNAIDLTVGRLITAEEEIGAHTYNPVGYVISREKRVEDDATGRIQQAEETRQLRSVETRRQRIA